MNKKFLTFIFLLFFSLSLLLFSAKKKLLFVADYAYPPYTFQIDNEPKGYCIDLIKEIEKVTGVEIEIRLIEWNKALKLIMENKADIIAPPFKSPEREKRMDFYPEPVDVIESVLFFNKNIPPISDLASLKEFTIGVQDGDVSVNELLKRGFQKIVYYPDYEAIVKDAKIGKIRVFLMDKPSGFYYLEKHGILTQFRTSKPLAKEPAYFAVPKGRKDVLDIISLGLKRIPKWRLEELREKWFGTEFWGERYEKMKREYMTYIYILIAITTFAYVFLVVVIRLYKKGKRKEKFIENEIRELRSRNYQLIDKISSVRNFNEEKRKSILINFRKLLLYALNKYEEEFYQSMLDLSFDVIDKADAASLYIKKNNKWYLMALKKFNIPKYKGQLYIESQEFFVPEDVEVVKELPKKTRLDEYHFSFKEYFLSIKDTLIIPVKYESEVELVINLDAFVENAFDDEQVEYAKILRSIFESLYEFYRGFLSV